MGKTADVAETLATPLMSYDLIGQPRLNKGTAFTEDERDLFHLHGLYFNRATPSSSLIRFAESADHHHRNPQTRYLGPA